MKVEELRIGNLITVEGRIITVRGIEADFNDLTEYATVNDWAINLISPIPLTEERLMKLGAQSIPHFTIGNTKFFDIGRNRQLSVSCVGTPNCMVFIQDIGNDTMHEGNDPIVLHNYDYDGPLYVHTFQNLYFALTRKELVFTDGDTKHE